MAMDHITNTYTSGEQILLFPDHYVCKSIKLAKTDRLATTTTEGRKVVLAGTIYPTNDDAAEGIIFSDQDVTDGDRNCACLIHGFVKTAKLPVSPTNAAQQAMKDIYFSELTVEYPTDDVGQNTKVGIYTVLAADATGEKAAMIITPGTANKAITVTADNVGVAGNLFSVVIVTDEIGAGQESRSLAAVLADSVVTVTLGTDITGALDASKNTATALTAVIAGITGITATVNGNGTAVYSAPVAEEHLIGGTAIGAAIDTGFTASIAAAIVQVRRSNNIMSDVKVTFSGDVLTINTNSSAYVLTEGDIINYIVY